MDPNFTLPIMPCSPLSAGSGPAPVSCTSLLCHRSAFLHLPRFQPMNIHLLQLPQAALEPCLSNQHNNKSLQVDHLEKYEEL